MTAALVNVGDAVEKAEHMVQSLRAAIDTDDRLPEKARQLAHEELDRALQRFYVDVARAVGILQ
jgi:hypothetical protein